MYSGATKQITTGKLHHLSFPRREYFVAPKYLWPLGREAIDRLQYCKAPCLGLATLREWLDAILEAEEEVTSTEEEEEAEEAEEEEDEGHAFDEADKAEDEASCVEEEAEDEWGRERQRPHLR